MKFIITESRFKKTVFKYLDNQDFIKLDVNGKIYLLNSSDDQTAEMMYESETKTLYTESKIIIEISDFFSVDFNDSVNLIMGWVEKYLGVNVEGLNAWYGNSVTVLKVPK